MASVERSFELPIIISEDHTSQPKPPVQRTPQPPNWQPLKVLDVHGLCVSAATLVCVVYMVGWVWMS